MHRLPKAPAPRCIGILGAIGAIFFALLPADASALPLFARQTGQNCIACHAGGQFPELTPYGRMFKLTGYTIGSQTVPLSIMAVGSYSSVNNTSKSASPRDEFQKNGDPIFATGSVFLGGRVTDNIGAFIQVTFDNYYTNPNGDSTAYTLNHWSADNIDIRFADHLIGPGQDLIYGITLNNNPSVTDPWNTAPAWNQYVPVPSPTSSQFVDGNAPYPGYAAGGNLAGLSGYLYWDKLVYAEIGGYQTAKDLFSFMSAGVDNADKTKIQGTAPYWRVALTQDWGPNSVMVGTSGMLADIYSDPLSPDSSMVDKFRDIGLDAQYQYILDPHTVTAQFGYMRDKHTYPAALANQPVDFFNVLGNPLAYTNSADKTNTVRAKLTYTYQAKYGGSLSFFNLTGDKNTANQTAGYDSTGTFVADPSVTGNLSGDPSTRGWTTELFWTPLQYVRLGIQYTAYNKFNGASDNYNGAGRNASDNNTLFLYVWGAY